MTFVIAFTIFIAYLFGRLLSRIAKEEVLPGEKYFLALQRFILVIISLTLLYISWIDFWVILTFFIGIIFYFVISERLFYFGLIVTVLSFVSRELLLVYSFFMILYSVSYGTLNKGAIKKLIYFIIPFSLLLFDFTATYHYLLLSFASGALLFKE